MEVLLLSSRRPKTRYRIPNAKEVITIRPSASSEPDPTRKLGDARKTAKVRQPAIADAARCFHTAATTGEMPSCMGFPAYQSPGRVRIQKEAVQARAMPSGPQGSASKNSI